MQTIKHFGQDRPYVEAVEKLEGRKIYKSATATEITLGLVSQEYPCSVRGSLTFSVAFNAHRNFY